MTRRNWMRRGWAAAGMGALLLGAAACGGDAAESTEAPEARVLALDERDVAVVQRGGVNSGVVLTGSLDPYQVVEVRAQVPGVVQGLRVDRGDAVRRGQVMATLQAAGIRGQAAGAQAGVAAAEAGLALARQQLESARTLYEAGAMSEIDFRGAQTQYESARAQLAAARGQAAGANEQAQRATVTAPISGEVSRREVSEGEAVNPGQALFTLVNTEQLELVGQVPVNQAALVRAGQPVEFELTAQPGRVLRGEVARVEPTADPATRQVGVYLRLPNRDRALVGGQFATGRILTGTRTDAITVPVTAVRTQGGESWVWVVENGVVQRRGVTLGERDEARGLVTVAGGLQGGETVVVSPGRLEEGARVRIGSASAAAQAQEG